MRKVGVVVMTVALLLVVACGGNAPGSLPASPSPSPTAPEPVVLTVTVETADGSIGFNHDNDVCLFADVQYELRDGAGTIIDVDRWEDDGASVGPSKWAAVGKVESLKPYLCVLTRRIVAPPKDIYTIEVSALRGGMFVQTETVSAEVSFRRDQADDVVVELAGR